MGATPNRWPRWLALCQLATAVLQVRGITVSVPDLHGDYDRGVEILDHAGLVDKKYLDDASQPVWVGGTTSLVQTGDIVDRGDHGKELYSLFQRLQKEAKDAGGQVVNLLGNHEKMNMDGDLGYVTAGDIAEYGGPKKRAKAWSEGGAPGDFVRTFSAVAKFGDVLFSHAGLRPQFLEGNHTVEDVNTCIKQAVAPASFIEGTNDTLGGAGTLSSQELLGDDGPLWTRFYAEGDEDTMCSSLDEVLKRTVTQRMVVGHTIQCSQEKVCRVRSRCNGRLVLADTAVSSAFIDLGGESSYVVHDGHGGAVAVYPRTGERQELPLGAAVGVIGEHVAF